MQESLEILHTMQNPSTKLASVDLTYENLLKIDSYPAGKKQILAMKKLEQLSLYQHL